jgi:hypothetical protein
MTAPLGYAAYVPIIREVPDRRSGGQLPYREHHGARIIEVLASDRITITSAGDLIVTEADRHTIRRAP